MLELRFHGRGGQGAVTSAELLAHAAIAAGKSAQAFPSFGPERRGAPVIAFARVADEAIRNRTAVRTPDVVVVLDPSLMRLVKVDDGLAEGGLVVVNSCKKLAAVRLEYGIRARLAVLDATRIAMEVIGRPITNTTMLGALLAACPLVPAGELEHAVEERFGALAPKNIAAFRRALGEAVIEDSAVPQALLAAG